VDNNFNIHGLLIVVRNIVCYGVCAQGRIQEFGMGEVEFMASVECEPIFGIWGFAPVGPGTKPLVRGLIYELSHNNLHSGVIVRQLLRGRFTIDRPWLYKDFNPS